MFVNTQKGDKQDIINWQGQKCRNFNPEVLIQCPPPHPSGTIHLVHSMEQEK
jgi:valyl-tRNA synthetase